MARRISRGAGRHTFLSEDCKHADNISKIVSVLTIATKTLIVLPPRDPLLRVSYPDVR
jgi:hypothetical protein